MVLSFMIVAKKGRRTLYYRCVGSQGGTPRPRPTSLIWITMGVLKPEIIFSVMTWLEASNLCFTRYRAFRPLWQLLIGWDLL